MMASWVLGSLINRYGVSFGRQKEGFLMLFLKSWLNLGWRSPLCKHTSLRLVQVV